MTRKYNKNKTSNKRIETYYNDALRIANSFNSKFILQDDKEGVALLALLRAARTYKKEIINKNNELVHVKFTTYLYTVVINALKNYVKRSKAHGPVFHNRRVVKLDKVTDKLKLPTYVLKFDDFDPYQIRVGVDSFKSIFDLLTEPDREDTLVWREFLFLVRKRLNSTQNKILDFCIDPDTLLLQDFPQPKSKVCTYAEIGKALNCSRQRIGQQMKSIRNVFENIQRDQNDKNFKLTKEEQGELYG